MTLNSTNKEHSTPRMKKQGVIKGTQAWDIFEFFFDLNKILICSWYIFEKKFAKFPSIFARISKFEHLRGDWAYAELFGRDWEW